MDTFRDFTILRDEHLAQFNTIENKTRRSDVDRRVLAVGGTRLELVTSTMSTWRSSQLS